MTNIELNNLNATAAAAAVSSADAPVLASVQTKATTSILSGDALTVSHAFSDLEKLLAQLKDEDAENRVSVAKQRLASVIDVLNSFSEEQTAALASIADLDAKVSAYVQSASELNTQLAPLNARSLELDLLIDQLEKAVQQNIKDGKVHRENVEKLKAVREEQAAELSAAEESLAALKNAAEQDATAIKAAEKLVAEKKSALDETDSNKETETAALAATETALKSNESNLAKAQSEKATVDGKIKSIKDSIADIDSKVSALQADISAAFSVLGESALASLAAALTADAKAGKVIDGERAETPAEVAKEDLKDIRNDPLRVVRESMDRVGELLEDLKTLDSSQPLKA